MCDENRICCYLYGSTHTIKPPEDLLKCAGSRVSYVLIENLKVFVIPKFPDVIVCFALIPGFLTYIALLLLITRLKGHRTDMVEAEMYFKKQNLLVEIADLDIKTALQRLDSGVKTILVLIIVLPLMLAVFIAKNNLVIATSLIVSLILSFIVFAKYTMTIRDQIVIEKTIELCREHVVLIIRGRSHIPYIEKKLREHGIKCIELSKICRDEAK